MGSSGINARYMGINTLISTYNYHHAIHCPSPKRPKDQRRLHRQGRQRKVHEVWRPHGNKMFETFSFLPPLSDADLTKQVQYLLNNGWTPCLEFEDPAHAYTDGHGWSGLDSSVNANYYDNRYWVMWKLPMYGCNNADEVIQEVKACVKAFPNCYVRCAGFDNIKQVQCAGFLCYRPKLDPMEGGARQVADRQV